MSIVDNIRIISKERNIPNIATLERTIGLGNGTIAKWDRQSPSCAKLQLVAEYLDCSIDTLVTGKNPIDYSLPIDEQQLLTDYRTVNSVSKAVIRERAKTLAEQEKSNKNNG